MAHAATSPLRAIDHWSTPLFIFVYQLLGRCLDLGERAVGDQVPTLEQLMLEYEVARDSGARVAYLANICYPARHMAIETTLL
jgi:hypothetical protein